MFFSFLRQRLTCSGTQRLLPPIPLVYFARIIAITVALWKKDEEKKPFSFVLALSYGSGLPGLTNRTSVCKDPRRRWVFSLWWSATRPPSLWNWQGRPIDHNTVEQKETKTGSDNKRRKNECIYSFKYVMSAVDRRLLALETDAKHSCIFHLLRSPGLQAKTKFMYQQSKDVQPPLRQEKAEKTRSSNSKGKSNKMTGQNRLREENIVRIVDSRVTSGSISS